MWYKITKLTVLGESPSPTSPETGQVPKNSVGKLLEKSDDGEWLKLFVLAKGISFAQGWIRKNRTVETKQPDPTPIRLPPFLTACVNAEIWWNTKNDTKPHFILADYLIALAKIEAQLKNPGPLRSDNDGVGPFQIPTQDWTKFTQANASENYSAQDRHDYMHQAFGAAWLTGQIVKQFSTKIGEIDQASGNTETSDETGPYIPSLIDIFLAHIVGVPASVKFRQQKFAGTGNTAVDTILLEFASGTDEEKAIAVDALLRRRHDFLKKDANHAETTDGMYAKIERRLDKELKFAFKTMQKHIPEDIPKIPDGTAAWMAIANQEDLVWDADDVSEKTAKGKALVKNYFLSTSYHPENMKPWCGAFVAHCLNKSGAKKAIVKNAASAASWKQFGNRSISIGSSQIPIGAIVVLAPAPGSSRSGHVGFFTRFLAGEGKPQIELLGGNQRDSVRLSKFPRAKIAAIRWLDTSPPPPPTEPNPENMGKLGNLLTLIASHESNGNYDSYYGRINNKSIKFTAMSIKQVLQWQDNFVAKGSRSSAVGKYQIIRKTLRSLVKSMKLNGTEIYDPAMQDRLAIMLLRGRKIDSFLAGSLSKDKFGTNLAREWASLPVMSGPKKGRSYYAGDGLNKAHVKVAEVLQVLNQLV